jgi:mevalonate kinase
MFTFSAHGKLLITGEYFVLDGADSLALPVRYGQSLRAAPHSAAHQLVWRSTDEQGSAWFEAALQMSNFSLIDATDTAIVERLQQILRACRHLNPHFLTEQRGHSVLTQLDFPRQWGLGTSSTLIAAVANWAGVNPYQLLEDTFGGSGYDIACATADGPIIYQRRPSSSPLVQRVHFMPDFADHLYFIYLGKKQDSRAGIARYRALQPDNLTALKSEISQMTQALLKAEDIGTFEAILLEHETLVSRTLHLPRAQDLHFPDFPGVIKSLGAWGGDFVLATFEGSQAELEVYLNQKTAIGFKNMISTLT